MFHQLSNIKLKGKGFLIPLLVIISCSSFAAMAGYYPVSVEPLISTEWGQEGLYGKDSPKIDGVSAPAGCGTIALAQFLKYYQHRPSYQLEEEVEYTTYEGNYVYRKIDTTSYDWALMPNRLTYASSKKERKETARFIADVGATLETEYSLDYGSAANATFVTYVLRSFFGMHVPTRGSYQKTIDDGDVGKIELRSDREWINILKKEISNGRPVLYFAKNGSGIGHVFLIDGYNKNDLFHVNWGWGGDGNGYYDINNLTPVLSNVQGSVYDPAYDPEETFDVDPIIITKVSPR